MTLITHRGNVLGSKPNLENGTAYMNTTLSVGLFAETKF